MVIEWDWRVVHPLVALVDEPEAACAKEGYEEGDIEAGVALAVGDGEGDEGMEEDTEEGRHGKRS
jgi:hypothetical protein